MLLTSTALTALAPTGASAADAYIDLGAEVTVIGTGGGTEASPWAIDDLYAGYTTSGELIVSAGGMVSNSLGYIGYDAGATGMATVTGTDSSWTNSSGISVGYEGTGTLLVSEGGTVSNATGNIGDKPGSEGEVTVTGAQSAWSNGSDVFVGREGTGTLTIADGGSVTSQGDGFIGNAATATGTAMVTGPGSSWTMTRDLIVGDWGTGTLTISNQGTASTRSIEIGYHADAVGTITVEGSGSELSSAEDLYIGWGGTGTLNVTTGGAVDGHDIYVGLILNSSGTITVAGAQSSVTAEDFVYVGYEGAGMLAISEGGTLSHDDNAWVGYDAQAVGTVTVSGEHSLWSIGDDLIVGEDGSGTVTLSDAGMIEADVVTIASGAGSTGTVNIGAASDHDAVAAGTLDAPMLEFGAGTGALVFNHTDTDHDFDADMTGSGTISHLAGTTTLSGDSSAFSGTTTVGGGTLVVNDALGGTVALESGATLGGSGTLHTVTIAAGGTLAPGNSIDTINVTTTTFDTGSTFEVELNDGGLVAGTNNDLLAASGAVTINGGTVHVTPENGTDTGASYTPGTYTIITAGSLTGAFDALTDDYAFLDFVLDYDYVAAQVDLISSLAGGGTCPVDLTANQGAACSGVLSVGAGDLYDAVITLSNTEAPPALDQLSGETHASIRTVLIEDSRAREAAINRLRSTMGGTGGSAGPVHQQSAPRSAFWAEGFGGWSSWGGNGNAAGISRASGGLFVGADAALTGNVHAGLLGGYTRSAVGGDDLASSANLDSYTIGAYGGGAWGPLSLKGGLAGSWHGIETSRPVGFSGFSDALSATYGARTLEVFAEASHGFDLGGARVEPFANLAHVRLETDGYTETGGAAALTGPAAMLGGTFTTLGIRSEAGIELGGMKAAASAGVGWRHAFGAAPTTTHGFTGGDVFTVAGVPFAQDTLVLDGGVEVKLTDNVALGVVYSGHFAADLANHNAAASLSARF